MKATGIVRNIDKVGRLVLPSELRDKFDLKPDSPVEILVEDDSIIVKKYEPACIFCNSVDNIVEFEGKKVCRKCIDDMKNL